MQLKNNIFLKILDSLEYILHVITNNHTIWSFMRDQRGYAVTAQMKKMQTLEFNLEAANVNSNFFMIFGSAMFLELVTVTFIGIRSSNFLHADTPDRTTLIYPLNVYFKFTRYI